jgi:hypothetical protein
MKLLVDTDAFCKLGIAGLLADSISILGVAELGECGRLAALPHMLRRGRLPKRYGVAACNGLLPLAEEMPVLPEPSLAGLDALTRQEAIDPGEAQIFAVAADSDLLVLSGDKRALRVLKNVAGLPESLHGRVVVLEAILLALIDRLGPEEVRTRVAPLTDTDMTIRICFSSSSADPRVGLESYYGSLADEVQPLILWSLHGKGGA